MNNIFGKSKLVPTVDMLAKARDGKYAVGHFNINNLEWSKTILEVAEETKTPVILGVSEGASKYMGGWRTISGMVCGLLDDLNISVPVALHLDHGSTFENAKNCIDAGFSSVMIDGSKLPIDENIKLTKKVTNYAHQHGVSVEAEVGLVGGEEDGVGSDDQGVRYAKFENCQRIIIEAKVDSLAASLGSVHGHYHGLPKLGYKEMANIRDNLGIPLVLHGGSGIPDEMILKAINSGECKINVNTECQEAFAQGLRKYYLEGQDQKIKKGYDPRVIMKAGMATMRTKIIEKMKLFGSYGKAKV